MVMKNRINLEWFLEKGLVLNVGDVIFDSITNKCIKITEQTLAGFNKHLYGDEELFIESFAWISVWPPMNYREISKINDISLMRYDYAELLKMVKIMEYEYTEMHFKMPSDALIEFEKGTDLYVIGGAATYRKGDMYNVVGNHMNLFTRKEKEIDYAKEFAVDTPWMVGDKAEAWEFRYACAYLPSAILKFNMFSADRKSENALYLRAWKFARHLTKEEEIKYLGAK